MALDAPETVIAPKGALTMATAGALFRGFERSLQRGAVVFDFAGVDRVDSAALALILAVLRKVQAGAQVRFIHVPQSIMSFAEIYGLEHVLKDGLAESTP
jgi:ABC-type transporter Mla MlaB component